MAPAGAHLPASTAVAAAAAAAVASPSAALKPAFLTPPLPTPAAVAAGGPPRQGAATVARRVVSLGRSAWASPPPPPSPLLRPCRIRLASVRGAASPGDERQRTNGARPPDGGTAGWTVAVALSSSTAAAEASASSPSLPTPPPTPALAPTSTTSTPLPVDDTDEKIADESARLLEWPAVSAAIARWASTPLGLLALSGALEPAAAGAVDDGDEDGGAERHRREEEKWVEPPPSLAASVAAARARRRRDLSRGMGYSGATADGGRGGGGGGSHDGGGATADAPAAAAAAPLLVRLGASRADSEQLLAETREAYTLEFRLARPLVFSGVVDAAPAVAAAARGFVLSGKELVGVATTLAAARRLRRQVLGTAVGEGKAGRGVRANGDGDLTDEAGGAVVDERPTASQAQFAAAFGGRVAAKAAADRRRKQTEASLGRRPKLVAPPAGGGGSGAAGRDGGVSASRSVELPNLSAMVARLQTFPDFERAITRAVDEQGDVRDWASPELAAVRSDVRAVRSGLRETAARLMARHADAVQDRVVTSRYGRAVLAVKAAKKGVFLKAVVHDVSATGATVFLEPFEMRGANDRLKTLEAKEQRVEEAVRRSLTERAVAPLAGDGGYAVLEEVVGALDAAAARARYSAAIRGVDVRFSADAADGGELSLRGVRHPLLVGQAVEQAAAAARRSSRKSGGGGGAVDAAAAVGLAKVVPVDYELGGHVRCAVVTGSNTGGKTSCIKALGVSVLLAKAGVFIHASTSNADDVAILPYFDQVLADIGDDQSLLASLSTFSGHIRRVTRILDATTPASLVLLDELGTGTNPAEGAALGISLLRYLAAGRARLVLATTHHGELTTLKYATPEENGVPVSEGEGEGAEGDTLQRRRRQTDDRFENASVEFDDVALRPTYRLIWGIPGRSHALSIAARLGCPPAIIEGARQSLTSAPRTGVILASGGGGGSDGTTADTNSGGGVGATPYGGVTTATSQASALIESLEEQRAAAEAAAADAAAARAEAVALRDELAARAAAVRAHEAELRAHQEAAFAKEMAAARSAIADVIRTMQRGGDCGGASAASAAEARAALAELEAAAAQSGGGVSRPPHDEERDGAIAMRSVVKGDWVVVPRLGPTEVEVVDAPAGKKELTVSWGGMRAKVKYDELTGRRAAAAPPPQPTTGRQVSHGDGGSAGRSGSPLMRTSANTVDLRGQRVEAALGQLDNILSRTLVLGGVWLLHGHGTGKLKRALREALNENDLVAAWRDGTREEGGSGVTVVTFK